MVRPKLPACRRGTVGADVSDIEFFQSVALLYREKAHAIRPRNEAEARHYMSRAVLNLHMVRVVLQEDVA